MLIAASAVFISVVFRYFVEYSAFPTGSIDIVIKTTIYWIPLNFVIFSSFHMYNRIWKYAGINEAIWVVVAVFCSFVIFNIIVRFSGNTISPSCYPLIWMFQTITTIFTRFSYRILKSINHITASRFHFKNNRIMIIGAGNAGCSLIREIERDRYFSHSKVICIIDDSPLKLHKYIGNAKVVGGRDKIVWAAKKFNIDEIIFAIPSASEETRHEFFDICKNTLCVIKTLPSIYQMINSHASISLLRHVDISDLLNRPQIKLDLNGINEFICGKTVLVTGGGGSIGSELCRQLAKYLPEKLIIFDIYENSAYYIQNELKELYPQLDIMTIIGSVRDQDRLDNIFATNRPDIVYHAAAHKHVPLMEDSPNEAIKNNVFGTLNTVRAADKYGVSRFVMISTDKAVNPTNVMGATKRICEMIIQYYDKHSKTEFVAVRFGNVLGSNGSVIPIFRKQIENGGPITVTHPDIIRYFMTIPEAVSLVLQAGIYAQGGEIFVLDMGEPVRILNLAENMVRLSGLVPYKDINIVFTGLRPGEKIFEELLMDEEGIAETPNKQIFIGKPIEMDETKFINQLENLKNVMDDESYDIHSLLMKIVPTYRFSALKKESNIKVRNQSNQVVTIGFENESMPLALNQ